MKANEKDVGERDRQVPRTPCEKSDAERRVLKVIDAQKGSIETKEAEVFVVAKSDAVVRPRTYRAHQRSLL